MAHDQIQVYIAAQLLGASTGAALVYINFFHAIDLVEGHGVRTLATARLFSTYAVSFGSQFVPYACLPLFPSRRII